MYVAPIVKVERESFEKHHGTLSEDIRWLKTKPVFSSTAGPKDAAATMSRLVGWSGDDTVVPHLARHKKDEAKIESFLQRNPLDPLNDEEEAFLKSIDLSWMGELSAFDHWSWVTSLPSEGREPHTPITMPIPDAGPLIDFTTIRLYQARVDGDLAKAVAETTHLAHLCDTSETLIGEMVAVAILRKIALIAPEHSPLNVEEVERAKRTVWGLNAVFSPFLDDKAQQRLLDESKGLNARCTSASEAATRSAMTRAFFEDKHQDFFQRIDTFSDESCHLTGYRYNKSKKGLIEEEIFSEKGGESWMKLPFVKPVAGSLLLSIAQPNFWKFYDDEAESSKEPPKSTSVK